HPGLQFIMLIKRNQAADHRFFPDGEANAVTELKSEARFFVGETEFLGLWPDGGHLRSGASRTNQIDGGVDVLPALLVGIDHGVRGGAYGERPVVTGAIAHVGMQDVVVNGIAWAEHAIGEDVRMRIATLAGN